MDAWDEGQSEDAKAKRLNMTPVYVHATISMMSECRADRWHLHARAATQPLGQALAKAIAA